MATVFLGRAVAEAGFERLVAIKLMHPQYLHQPEFEAMFFDEARLAARIRHPNVVGTLDVQKAPDGLFLVMDYVEGPTLSAIIQELRAKGQQVPIEITLRITCDFLAGLQIAHELRGPGGRLLGLVHRDVSPQNILVGGDGITRITDFGVARANVRASVTGDGEVKGKLGYMPPEQLAGSEVDASADVYAAGVVLWEALVGRRLFVGGDPGLVIGCVLRGAQIPPREERHEVPERVDRACMRALSLDPSSRFGSAAAFAEELENAARASGLDIATPREVGLFVRRLDAYVARIVPPDVAYGSEPPPRPRLPPQSVQPPSVWSSSRRALAQVGQHVARHRWLAALVIAGMAGGVGAGIAWRVARRSTPDGVGVAAADVAGSAVTPTAAAPPASAAPADPSAASPQPGPTGVSAAPAGDAGGAVEPVPADGGSTSSGEGSARPFGSGKLPKPKGRSRK